MPRAHRTMKLIKGSGWKTTSCGGNYHSWAVVEPEDLRVPGSVEEPCPGFHRAVCTVFREVSPKGEIKDVRVVARHAEQWWDDAADNRVVVPTHFGCHIEVENLNGWFNVGLLRYFPGTLAPIPNTTRRSAWVCLWRAAKRHAKSTKGLLDYVRDHVSKNGKVLKLYENDTLMVD